MPKSFPASADTTYGLFHATLQFESEVEFKRWLASLLDFEAVGAKEKLAPVSRIWMGGYPRTTLFEKNLQNPLTVKDFLQFLRNSAASGQEFFEIVQNQNSFGISAYLGSYQAIGNYTELLFLVLFLAAECGAAGGGFLFPDNYYYDFCDFVDLEMKPGAEVHLECSDLQNAREDLTTRVAELEPIIKGKYQQWLESIV